MSDIVDHAERLEAMVRDAGITRARIAVAGPGSDVCEDCGDDIEPTRRAAMPAATRCSCCQHDFEHHNRVELAGGRGFFDPSQFNRPAERGRP